MFKDNDFISTCDVPGPTKEEIRALILYKSDVGSNDTVVDIGCGTGGITVEFLRFAKKVYSIDKNPDAIELTGRNIKNLIGDDSKSVLLETDGVSGLKSIDNFDIAIIGGSGNDLNNILDEVDLKLNPKGRIIITGILIDTKVEAVNKLKDLGYNPQIIEVNVSRGRVLDRGIMMMANNPIAIINSLKK